MKNDKNLHELENSHQSNNPLSINEDYTDKLISQEEYKNNLIMNAIFEYESNLKDDEEPGGYTLEESMKRVKKAVWNID